MTETPMAAPAAHPLAPFALHSLQETMTIVYFNMRLATI